MSHRFGKVNQAVKQSMRVWCEKQFGEYLRASMSKHEEGAEARQEEVAAQEAVIAARDAAIAAMQCAAQEPLPTWWARDPQNVDVAGTDAVIVSCRLMMSNKSPLIAPWQAFHSKRRWAACCAKPVRLSMGSHCHQPSPSWRGRTKLHSAFEPKSPGELPAQSLRTKARSSRMKQ